MKVSVIIPSAGHGRRFGALKQFKLLNGEPIVVFAIRPFLSIKQVVEIIIVVSKNQISFLNKYFKNKNYKKNIKIVEGGDKRQDSVIQAINSVVENSQLICIHDAVRPFIKKNFILSCIKKCNKYDGAILAIKSTETVKFSKNKIIKKTINRDNIWLAQTPQVFHKNKLIKAIKNAKKNKIYSTDESSLMEKMGFNIRLVEGCVNNIKITYKSDWGLVKFLQNNFL